MILPCPCFCSKPSYDFSGLGLEPLRSDGSCYNDSEDTCGCSDDCRYCPLYRVEHD